MDSRTAIQTLLAELARCGIQLRVEGERLRYSAPPDALTTQLREQLQACKQEVIAFLRGQSAVDAEPAVRTHPPSFVQRRFWNLQQLAVDAEPAVRTHPPSFVQRRFWNLQQLNPTEAFYNAPFVFRLRGPLDTALLQQSFNEIVRRHESLRTTLQELNGELMQVIAPTGQINLLVVDSDAISRSLLLEVERPFDLAREAGLRVLLLRLEREEFILQLCFHNTLFDQSSLLNILKELSLHYAAGGSAGLPPPTQYSEYVRWQESFLTSGMEERRKYWTEWFGRGEPPAWTWKDKLAGGSPPAFHSHVTWLRSSPELTQQLKALSQRNGATLYISLIAAYAVILRRYTGCADITLGTTYSNRHHWQFESLIGATIDVPALRIDMTDDPSLEALLARVRAVVAAALTYQDVPIERVASRKLSGPLFRMVFSFFPETPHGRLQLPGMAVTFLEELVNEVSRPDLYLVLWENQTPSGDALTGYWMHKQDVFAAETAARMNQEFQALLRAMALDILDKDQNNLTPQ